MKWSEVKAKYPNKFIKFEVLDSHIDGDVEIVDTINLIGVYSDGKEAMKEHLNRKEGQYVCSTLKDRLGIQRIRYIGIRGKM